MTVYGPRYRQSRVCMPILRKLPAWFGIEEALAAYSQDIDVLPTFLAGPEHEPHGFLTLKRHFEESAEILVMGVLPQLHRNGIGRSIVAAAEEWLRAQGVQYLHVKTLAASHPDQGYEHTRAFYRAMGFSPLEEFPTLWNEANPALVLVKKL